MKKSVTIFCNIAITEEILSSFRRVGVEFYTSWPRITGRGKASGPRLDNHIWPGANAGFNVIADEENAERLMDELQRLRNSEEGSKAGLYAYMTSVERVLS